MSTIKMLADLFTCFTLERRPKLLWEEFLVWESLATEEISKTGHLLNGRPANFGISFFFGWNLWE
jgi:hypothetical protein